MKPVTVHIIKTTKSEAQAALKSTRGLALNADARVIIIVAAGPESPAQRAAERGRNACATSLMFSPRWPSLSPAFCT
jgi:hypothetical protein